ncbi:hypothetical protein [Streptomyces sp. URMC 123]|uniref:hypothetical protein n=1 Tax=Streptomyces sp. URMC 123 TaxID=3423403 RepID=UPI003F1DBDB3
MTTNRSAPADCRAHEPDAAAPAAPPPPAGAEKDAARKGVLSARPRAKRFPADEASHSSEDPTPATPGIRIYAPPAYRHHWDGARWSKRYGDTPTAAYACTCGHTATATGDRAVADLVNDYEAHKHFCTGRPAALAEGRAAA